MLLSHSVHQTILSSFAIISVCSNSLLIVLVLQRQSRELGRYRWLLMAFSIGDIIISLYHAAVVPTYFQIEYGCVAFTWAGLYKPPRLGFIINTIYCVLFYEPFIILMFHFIYRYLHLTKPNIIPNNSWWFALFAVLTNVFFSSIISFSSVILDWNSNEDYFGAELQEVFGIDRRAAPNLIPMNFLHVESLGGGVNWKTIGAICNSGVVAVVTLAVDGFCSLRIMAEFKSFSANLSTKTRKMQINLFRALQIQFLVPFVLCFIPFAIIVTLPITGIRFGEFGTITANVVSIFPALDAFLVMFMVRRFRSILVEWTSKVGLCPSSNNVSSITADSNLVRATREESRS